MSQRRNRLVAAPLIAVLGLVALAGLAGASGESVGACMADHLLELVEEEHGDLGHVLHDEKVQENLEKCFEAPNPILPETNESVVMQTIGPEGRKFMPFLTTMFFFILFSNIFEVIPGIQFPANSRMAFPITLAIVVWVIYNVVGIRAQGLGGYLRNSLFPPGVPVALYIIVTPIELVSTFVVRPFSLAIRLWANMVAGHLLLVTFGVLTQVLWDSTYIGAVAPFAMLVLMTGFEILVSVLQAFIFTILTAVYIGGSMHPAH